MGKFSPLAQVPRYMTRFQCRGSDCIENCCTGWKVAVDKPTFQRYRSVKIEPLGSLLQKHVVKQDGPGAYAAIKLGRDEPCPFLDTARLCRIHSELGTEALSTTCSEYPRVYSRQADQHGMAATLSCPEAARLALASADAMDMVEIELPFANPGLVPVTYKRAAPKADEQDLVRKHAGVLQEVMSAVIRWPHFSAAQALVYGGLILRKVAKLAEQAAAQSEAGLAEALEHYLHPDQLARAAESAKAFAVPKHTQVGLLLGATQRYLRDHGGRPSFRLLIDDVRAGLLGDATSVDVATAHFVAAEAQYFNPIDQAQPQLLKNFLLNDINGKLFPAQGAASLEADFMALAVRFALIKFYLVGVAAHQGEAFSAEQFSRVVYVVTRNIEHNRSFMPMVIDTLREQDLMQLHMLATLVS